ncbi:hypothetical protein [Aquimarina rhabdastrellae]
MYYLNYTHTLRALDGYVAVHNKEKTNYKERVRPAMVATAQQLLKIYGIALAKAYKRKAFTKEELPALRTNNVQLAKLTHASTRTVQRHLVRLQAAGIITKKKWNGSKAPFELWFTAKVLSLKLPEMPAAVTAATLLDKETVVNNPVEKPVNKLKNEVDYNFLSYTDNQCFKNKNTTIGRHTDTSNTTSNINNRIIRVNKLLTPIEKIQNLSKRLTGYTGQERTPLPLRPSLRTGYTTGNTQEKALQKNKVQEKVVSWEDKPSEQDKKIERQTARESLLQSYAEKLWEEAKKKLYRKTHLSMTQEEIAKELLYEWYAPVSNEKLAQVHGVYTKRIELVRRYVNLAPDVRYVQLPYLFFDPENPNGFTRTKTWVHQDSAYQKRKRIQRKFFAILNYFKSNETAESSKAIPRLECFKRCEAAIKTLKRPELLQEFYKISYQIVQPESS